MDATRSRRTRDEARRLYYSRHRTVRFARLGLKAVVTHDLRAIGPALILQQLYLFMAGHAPYIGEPKKQ